MQRHCCPNKSAHAQSVSWPITARACREEDELTCRFATNSWISNPEPPSFGGGGRGGGGAVYTLMPMLMRVTDERLAKPKISIQPWRQQTTALAAMAVPGAAVVVLMVVSVVVVLPGPHPTPIPVDRWQHRSRKVSSGRDASARTARASFRCLVDKVSESASNESST